MTFDSTSSNLDERQKSVILTLRDRPYDNVRHTGWFSGVPTRASSRRAWT